VQALVLLEASLLSLSDSAAHWAEGAKQLVYAAAEVDMNTVAETLLRIVAGDAAWEGFPEPAKEMFTANRPAIVAELRGGFLDVTPDQLGTIDTPTLLVAAEDSPPAFAEVTTIMAEAIPSARVASAKGGHLVRASDPAVLGFIDTALGRSA
jgi:pimeloyl-ACP methyl ester carboxylesterase